MERRPVIQIIFPAEIQQREPVAEHHQTPRRAVHDVPERIVQCLQFVQIVRQPSPIAVGIVRIGLTQRIADGPAQGHGVHRRCPDVLVVLYFLFVAIVQMPVMVVVIMVVVIVVVVRKRKKAKALAALEAEDSDEDL